MSTQTGHIDEGRCDTAGHAAGTAEPDAVTVLLTHIMKPGSASEPQHVCDAVQRKKGPHSVLPSLHVSAFLAHQPPAQHVSSAPHDTPPQVMHVDVAAMQREPRSPAQHTWLAAQIADPHMFCGGGLGAAEGEGAAEGDAEGLALGEGDTAGHPKLVAAVHTLLQQIWLDVHVTVPHVAGAPDGEGLALGEAEGLALGAGDDPGHPPELVATTQAPLQHIWPDAHSWVHGVGAPEGEGLALGAAGHVVDQAPLESFGSGTHAWLQHICIPVHVETVLLAVTHGVRRHAKPVGMHVPSQHVPVQTEVPQ